MFVRGLAFRREYSHLTAQLGEMGAIVRIHAYLEKEGIINVNATEPSRAGALHEGGALSGK
jgi:hypothetical protein